MKTLMHGLGFTTMSDDDIDKCIKETDLNNNNTIEFGEFLTFMKKFETTGKENQFQKVTTTSGKNIFRVGKEGATSYSSFSEEERSAFVKVINSVLINDEVCKKYLPMDPDTMEIFTRLKNGIILCKLVNRAQPGTIDERVINIKDNMNIFFMTENLKLALSASKSIGCQISNIFPDSFTNENRIHALGVLWQLIKLVILKEVNLKSHPQMIRLLREGEDLNNLLKCNPENLLLRWFNYHLNNAGYDKEIKNFTGDIKDSEKYLILLNQLNGKICDKSGLNETDTHKRADAVLKNSQLLGVESYITSKDICEGNQKLNTLFTAAIFNHCHGLDPPTEQEAYEAAELLKDDTQGSREERAFSMWINSLDASDDRVTNLYEYSKSGVLLLKVIDKVKPGSVQWKKVDEKTTNRFKVTVNCNEAVDACKRIGLSAVGIGGTDIQQGNKKYILALVWQLMRAHTLEVIGNKTEDDLISWANGVANYEVKIANMRDKKMKDSLFLINIMNAIEPRAVNWDIIEKGNLFDIFNLCL